MTENTDTSNGGGGDLPPATPPKSDAEAAAQQPATPAEVTEPAKPAPDKADEEKKRNRTRDYIDKLNRENAELRRYRAEQEARAATPQRSASQPVSDEPTLEQHNYDLAAYQRAHTSWAMRNEREKWEQEQKTQAEQARQRETFETYQQRVYEFADSHPDFPEVVGSIAYPLSDDLQAAIAAHPQGPELAYHLGLNDDEAFALASIQPHLAAAAVERLAKRLSAAPAAPPAPIAPIAPPKPITQAPPPPPTVGGRAPTETPAEKLTDDDWYKRDREKRRKR